MIWKPRDKINGKPSVPVHRKRLKRVLYHRDRCAPVHRAQSPVINRLNSHRKSVHARFFARVKQFRADIVGIHLNRNFSAFARVSGAFYARDETNELCRRKQARRSPADIDGAPLRDAIAVRIYVCFRYERVDVRIAQIVRFSAPIALSDAEKIAVIALFFAKRNVDIERSGHQSARLQDFEFSERKVEHESLSDNLLLLDRSPDARISGRKTVVTEHKILVIAERNLAD